MTDADKIAALAAELTRIGKMPEWSTGGAIRETKPRFRNTHIVIINDEAHLAALSGVAGEVIAFRDKLSIHEFGGQWYLEDHEKNIFGHSDSYHEALIAALKQVESEVKS